MTEKSRFKSQTGWQPLAEDKISAIRQAFADLLPVDTYSELASRVSRYWIDCLRAAWDGKADFVKEKDRQYDRSDPLSRIEQRTVIIAYPDSIHGQNQATLTTLDRFLQQRFSAAGGLHILPACEIVENRFNDGYFSQVRRNRIHRRFGTDDVFGRLTADYFSMADFVLNHVDIANPNFRAYLNGDDTAGDCFYVFTEKQYQQHRAKGDFDRIFRPRPFPLFTIFRRRPAGQAEARMTTDEKYAAINALLTPDTLAPSVIGILSIFAKIENDQMLLENDAAAIRAFRQHLKQCKIDPDTVFAVSQTQETRHTPYVFRPGIDRPAELLCAIGHRPETAERMAGAFETLDAVFFGEPIRAMTTFSHVQIDVNTSTFAGLKMLADDFAWYLGMNLNMLRLDAANFAFKKWQTSCFGLPEVKQLMRILSLSLECVSPRTVPNMEVNDKLGRVLSQMADSADAPPMMYDFHLASILPVVFNTQDARILERIFELIGTYDIAKDRIRFSIADSHDGKSVRGSLDLLTVSERQGLADTVVQNGGRVKYQAVARRQCPAAEFDQICAALDLPRKKTAQRLFKQTKASPGENFYLKENITKPDDILKALGQADPAQDGQSSIDFFINKTLYGKEPYELCTSTRDAMVRLRDDNLEAARYLAFYTLAFALMGRNVKSVFFNDLVGLPNDHERMERTGEFRDIKRTRSDFQTLMADTAEPVGFSGTIARGMNALIAMVDHDPALGVNGDEAQMLSSDNPAVAAVYNHCRGRQSLAVINTSAAAQSAAIQWPETASEKRQYLYDNIGKTGYTIDGDWDLSISLKPFQRLWLTHSAIPVAD
ncbi:MAG: hypothetical protein ACQERN_05805 [Thermodesulfobacteriota bacterium]